MLAALLIGDRMNKRVLAKYRADLLACTIESAESVYQRVADSFEDDLLELDGFPAEYLEFLSDLLSEEKLYSKPGAWHFVLLLCSEGHKLQSPHYEKLANTILMHYAAYENEDLCLAVCDFIARSYGFDDAKRLFSKLDLIEISKPPSLQGFVADGRRILAAEEARAHSS